MRPHPHRLAALLLAAGAASLPVALTGCDTGPQRVDQRTIAEDPDRALALLAEAQRQRPDKRAARLAPPAGVRPDPDEPGRSETPERTLTALLDDLAGRPVVEPRSESETPEEGSGEDADAPIDPETRAEALRAYIQGRDLLLRGELEDAHEKLRQATRLDPRSGEAWRDLGEARLRIGLREPATEAFQQAVRLGMEQPRTLFQLAGLAERRGDLDEAIRAYARALAGEPARNDPALHYLISAGLGWLLLEHGDFAAASEALRHAADLPEQPPPSPQYARELRELYRRQGELWRSVGDAEFRLGRDAEALKAYERADRLPSLEPESRLSARIYASIRLGRPAEAALHLLDSLDGTDQAPSDRLIDLTRYIAAAESTRPALKSALYARVGDSASAPVWSVASRTSRLLAAASEPDEAREVLRAHLNRWPDDSRAQIDLFQIYRDSDDLGRVREAAALARRHPVFAPSIAVSLLNATPRPSRLATTFLAVDETDRAILEPFVLTGLHRHSEAIEALPEADLGSASLDVLVPTLFTAASAGHWDLALAALEGVEALPDSHLRTLALSRGLRALQRYKASYEAALSLLDAEGGATGDAGDEGVPVRAVVLDVAELAVGLGRYNEAAEVLAWHLESDPGDERVAEALISMYLPERPLADRDRLQGLVRDLQEISPEGRAFRWIRATELARQGRLQELEEELLELAGADAPEARVLDMLVRIWVGVAESGQRDPALAGLVWIERKLERRPELPRLISARARVLAALGRAEEAESLLAEALESVRSRELARLREQILRDELDRGEEADELELSRLLAAPPTPDYGLELGEALLERGRVGEAVDAATGSIPPEATLTTGQSERVVAMLRATAERVEGPDGEEAVAFRRLLDLAATHDVRFDIYLHALRLRLLTEPPADVDRSADAVVLAAQQHPEEVVDFALSPVDRVQEDDPERAVSLLGEIVQRLDPDEPRVLQEWQRRSLLYGDAEQIRMLIDYARDDSYAMEVFLAHLGRTEETPEGEQARHAELSYLLASRLWTVGREDVAESIYRLTLRLDPEHAWASNDFGYYLLDSGRDLSEAARLIERAYELKPGSSSITDSLGWLRYHQGLLEDRPGSEDGAPMPGAVTLLRRALEIEDGAPNPIIHDHLGDALWRAGEREEAVAMWSEAVRLGREQRNTLRRALGDDFDLGWLDEVIELSEAKLRAVAEDERPPVAPMHGADSAAGDRGEHETRRAPASDDD